MSQRRKLDLFVWMFGAFILSPQFKHAMPFAVPDITVVLGGLLLPWAGIKLYYERLHNFLLWPLLTILGFTVWVLLSLNWGPGDSYAIGKALRLLLFVGPAFLIAQLLIARKEDRLKNLYTLFIGASFLVCLNFGWQVILNSSTWYMQIFGTNYLMAGSTLGLGLLVLTGRLLTQPSRWYNLGGSIILIAILFALGGRGPVLASIASIVLTMFLFKEQVASKHKRMIFYVLGSLVGIVVILTLLKSKPTLFFHRLHVLSEDESILLRLNYYGSAFKALWTYPLTGVGIGGWRFWDGAIREHNHPHNILLETLAEAGLIGALFLSALVFGTGRIIMGWRSKRPNVHQFLLTSFFLFAFLNACKTGDIYDNIHLFVFMGLIYGQEKKKITPIREINILP